MKAKTQRIEMGAAPISLSFLSPVLQQMTSTLSFEPQQLVWFVSPPFPLKLLISIPYLFIETNTPVS